MNFELLIYDEVLNLTQTIWTSNGDSLEATNQTFYNIIKNRFLLTKTIVKNLENIDWFSVEIIYLTYLQVVQR